MYGYFYFEFRPVAEIQHKSKQNNLWNASNSYEAAICHSMPNTKGQQVPFLGAFEKAQ